MKQYIVNYNKDTFKLKLLKGVITLRDLIINRDTVNADLDRLNLPFRLTFGVIKTLMVDVSILGVCLEEIVIEDLVVVISPDPSKADRNLKMSDKDYLKLLEELIGKYQNYDAWMKEVETLQERLDSGEGVEDPSLSKKLKKKISGFSMKRCSSLPKDVYKEMLAQEVDDSLAFNELPAQEYQTIEEKEKYYSEWMETIKNNLDAKIRIKNLRVFYEDPTPIKNDRGEDQLMVMCLAFDSITLQKVERPK